MSGNVRTRQWLNDVARKFDFSPAELAQGLDHPLVQDLVPFLPGQPTNDYIVNLINTNDQIIGNLRRADGQQVTIKTQPLQIYHIAEKFMEGYRRAQTMFPEPGRGEYYQPQSIFFLPNNALPEDRNCAAAYVRPKEVEPIYVTQGSEEPFQINDSIIMTEWLFTPAITAMQNNGLVDRSDLGRKLPWDEEMFLCGFEEGCHLMQEKHPELRKKIDREVEALVKAGTYNPLDRETNPRETDVAQRIPAVLQEYRAAKSKSV